MAPESSIHRFPVKRIAVTVPPDHWFHGIARAMFYIYREALVQLGFEIFDVPVDTFLVPDATRIANLVSDLRAFRPELAFGLPKGSYALICRLPPRRDGWRPNLFTEVLDIPTICLWDHAPLELADQLLAHPENPSESAAGAMETLRRSLTDPRLIHWSPDTGQTQIMEELGFLLPGHVIQESLPSLPGFHSPTSSVKEASAPGVAFIGHFYQEPPVYPDVDLEILANGAIREWLLDTKQPLWYVLAGHLDGMDPDQRKQLGLDRDQTYFWHFAHRLILHSAQTARRLSILGSAGVPVACYGDLKTDVAGVPGNLTPIPGNIPFGPDLAAVLARHTITIDVFNPGSVHGYSHKPMMAFAAGGFMLVDRKRDFVHAFGEAGEAVSYDRDVSAKIGRFLTNPAYRLEVGEAIRQTIAARFQLKDVLKRVIDLALLRAAPAASARPLGPPARIVTIKKLLKKMRCRPEWSPASVEHRDGIALILAPHQWDYAAEIHPGSVYAMREPHLRLNLIVEAGRIGVAALLDDSGTLIGEQFLSASQGPIGITVELPHKGVSTVILRNAAVSASRARVLEASLCDRVTRPA
ncbi:MAG: glycosyltransferase [Acidobacteriia bacterium]|nr:glycosyltransferase [Terriglobia bacterium]